MLVALDSLGARNVNGLKKSIRQIQGRTVHLQHLNATQWMRVLAQQAPGCGLVGMGGFSGRRIRLICGISAPLCSPMSLGRSLRGTQIWSGAMGTCESVTSFLQ